MTYNAASRKDVRAAEKAARASLVVRGEVISGIMSIPNGRQWMFERLSESFVFADPFHHDPAIHAYNAGLRSAGIKMFNDIILFCPNQFTNMIEESHVRDAAADERTNRKDGDGRDQGSSDDNNPSASFDRDYDPFDYGRNETRNDN